MRNLSRPVLMFILVANITIYGLYSMSFAAEYRPADLSRGESAIILAIYFVGFAALITQKED